MHKLTLESLKKKKKINEDILVLITFSENAGDFNPRKLL